MRQTSSMEYGPRVGPTRGGELPSELRGSRDQNRIEKYPRELGTWLRKCAGRSQGVFRVHESNRRKKALSADRPLPFPAPGHNHLVRLHAHDFIAVQLIMMVSLNWTEACAIDPGLVRRWSPIFANHAGTLKRNGDNLRLQAPYPFHESQHEDCMP